MSIKYSQNLSLETILLQKKSSSEWKETSLDIFFSKN